ncbi:MAG: hypothetical protein NTY02_19085 [Acidobacteria bacterium]|nr:hypothetical protein [Acidobacteriota bacterium]
MDAPTKWTWAAYGWLCIVWLGLSSVLIRLPFQVSDMVGNLLALRNVSLWDILKTHFSGGTYLRPFVWGYFKVVFDISGGHYYWAYKAVEIAQVGALFLLFGRLLAVRTRVDLFLMSFATVVLIGIHTFGGFVWENYPINTFLTIAVLTLAVLNIAESPARWPNDVAAPAVLFLAMFMVESGLLVWVALVTAWLAGAKGVSRRGIAVSTVVFLGYFVLRFALLSGGTPGLDERGTGFGFAVLDPDALQARFGHNPLPFYASNILSSLSSLLLSEPRYGLWEFTRALVTSEYSLQPWMAINVSASLMTTAVVLAYSLARLSRWIRLDIGPSERLVVVFWGLAAANAVLSYAYNKDQIVSVAGCVYPLAVFVAVRQLIADLPRASRVAKVVLVVGLAVASAAWTTRAVGLGYVLHNAAYRHRNDWVRVDRWLESERIGEKDPSAREFVLRLKQEMLGMEVPHPSVVYGRWGDRYFDQHP